MSNNILFIAIKLRRNKISILIWRTSGLPISKICFALSSRVEAKFLTFDWCSFCICLRHGYKGKALRGFALYDYLFCFSVALLCSSSCLVVSGVFHLHYVSVLNAGINSNLIWLMGCSPNFQVGRKDICD